MVKVLFLNFISLLLIAGLVGLVSAPVWADDQYIQHSPIVKEKFGKSPRKSDLVKKFKHYKRDRHRYHRRGHHVRNLPRANIGMIIHGLEFFYHLGAFYRPEVDGYVVVLAPIGAVVRNLPNGYISFHIGSTPYYYINHTYYEYHEHGESYIVVDEPQGAKEAMAKATGTNEIFVYPKKGESKEQLAENRFQCHRFAVLQAKFDPSLGKPVKSQSQRVDYQDAVKICLEASGYSVK